MQTIIIVCVQKESTGIHPLKLLSSIWQLPVVDITLNRSSEVQEYAYGTLREQKYAYGTLREQKYAYGTLREQEYAYVTLREQE
jgi:hypothetical protein